MVLPFVPAPDLASLPYLLAGILLHVGYQLFLLYSYRTGDLTQVYPIARGAAPLIVTLTSIVFLGVSLRPIELLAVATIGVGIISMSLIRQDNGARNLRAAGMALGTGCFIAGYSLVDGLGARVAGTALGYYGWLTIGNGIVFTLYVLHTRPGVLAELPRLARRTFLIGGTASSLAYALVTWAFTQAPIALVTALREVSVVFALIIGVAFLKEKVGVGKVVSVLLALSGAILLRFAND